MNAPKIVIIESPYFNRPDACRYLACCLLDSLSRGESPLASHGLYPLALGEHTPPNVDGKTGREQGLAAWTVIERALANSTGATVIRACYVDVLPSAGMLATVAHPAVRLHVDVRRLEGEAKSVWERGDWPSPARLTPNHEQPITDSQPDFMRVLEIELAKVYP